MGVIMFTLLVGKPPFESKDFKITYQRITENIYSFPEDVTLSINAKNLIRELLHPDAACRPTIEEILEHSFFTDNIIPNSVPISSMRFPPNPRSKETQTSELFWEETTPNISSNTNQKQPFIFAGTNSNNTHKKSINSCTTKNPLAPTSLNTAILSPTLLSRKRKRNGSLVNYPMINTGLENENGNSASNTFVSKQESLKNDIDSNELLLDSVLKSLDQILDNKIVNPVSSSIFTVDEDKKNHLHVSRWVDESKRVGIGFHLTNQTSCVYFNDDTKIAYNPNSK